MRTIADSEQSIRSSFSAVADGKSAIAAALTAKGIPTTEDSSFDTLALNVSLTRGFPLINDVVTVAGNAASGESVFSEFMALLPDDGWICVFLRRSEIRWLDCVEFVVLTPSSTTATYRGSWGKSSLTAAARISTYNSFSATQSADLRAGEEFYRIILSTEPIN